MGRGVPAFFTMTPVSLLLIVLLFVAAMQVTGARLLMRQPWTGIHAADAGVDTLVIKSIDEGSPAFGKFTEGETLRGLQTGEGLLKLTPILNSFAPLSPATFAQQETFRQRQAALHRAFTHPAGLTFVTTTGKTITLKPAAHMPLSAIPWVFWLMCYVSLISPLVGALVWTYRPYQKESLFLLFHSLFYYVFAVGGAVVIASEFHMASDALKQDLLLQVIGINFAAALILVILCYVPKTLARGQWLFWVIMGITAFSTANYHYQWFETPGHIFYMQYPVLYLITVAIIALQIRRTRSQPVERASLLVLAVAFMLPNAIIIALHVIPILLGVPPIVGNIPALLLFDLMAVGLAVGILRYRLFDIEFWWLKSMLWVLGGCMVACIDLGLTVLLNTPQRYSLGISVIIAGFLYFPLRQWLLGKLIPLEQQNLQNFLPVFSSRMSDAISRESFEQRWRESLLQRFSPIHMETLPEQAAAVLLSGNGLHLLVSSLCNRHSYRLSGKQRAARLFSKADVKNTESLLTIARMAANASEMRQQAIMEERRRIMHDLHDSVGAKLLTLTHKLPDPAHKGEIKAALAALRDIIRLSTKVSPLRLDEHVADWRAEIAERAEAASVDLKWRQSRIEGDCQLTPRQALELTQIIREIVSNALKHAAPTSLSVACSVSGHILQFAIRNDGRVSPPHTWKAGTGLKTMQRRIKALDGKMVFSQKQGNPNYITASFILPIKGKS